MHITEVFTPTLLKELRKKLLEGNARSIFLNCLPGNYRSRAELVAFEEAMPGLGEEIINWLLNPLLESKNISLRGPGDERTITQAAGLLKTRLDNVIIDDRERKQTFGLSSLAIGYPIVQYVREIDEKKYIAPLFVWSVDIEKNAREAFSFVLTKREEGPKLNDALMSLFDDEVGAPLEIVFGADGMIDKEKVEQLVNQINLRFHFQRHFKTTEAIVALATKAEIETTKWINTAVIGLFDQSKEPIIKVLKELENEDFLRVPGLESELRDFSKMWTSIPIDPSQQAVASLIKRKKNLIIQGPPGTGKSRTLASLITSVIATGGKVLVVCEKDTALDVLIKNLIDAEQGKCSSAMLLKLLDVRSERAFFADKVQAAIEATGNNAGHEEEIGPVELESLRNSITSTEDQITSEKTKLFEKVLDGYTYRDVIGEYLKVHREYPSIPILEPGLLIDELNPFQSILHELDELQESFTKVKSQVKILRTFDANYIKSLNPLSIKELSSELERIEKIFKNIVDLLYGIVSLAEEDRPLRISFFLKLSAIVSSKARKIKELLSGVLHQYGELSKVVPIRYTNGLQPFAGGTIKSFQEYVHSEIKTTEELTESTRFLYYWKDYSEHLAKTETIIQDVVYKLEALSVDAMNMPWSAIVKNTVFQQTLRTQNETNNFQSGEVISGLIRALRLKENESNEYNRKLTQSSWSNSVVELRRTTDWQTAKFELTQKRASRTRGPRKSIHQLFHRYLPAIQNIFPVILTNPVTAAVLFGKKTEIFDLVIFDEASQLRLEETLSSLAYGKQIIISGDKHQMPPFDFGSKSVEGGALYDGDGDDSGEEMAVAPIVDLANNLHLCESLLEFAYALKDSHFEDVMIECHYRSGHPDLINFSNYAFYDGRLLPLPPTDEYVPIEFVHVDGLYRMNPGRNEMEADWIVEYLRTNQSIDSKSIGIATLNLNQRNLIYDKIVIARELDHSFDQKMSRLETQGLFIKNLVNIQGDERDIIILSCTFGYTEAGTFSSNFGPINNKRTGYKLLNVLVTRAKEKLIVLCSIPRSEYHSVNSYRGDTATTISGRSAFLAYLAYAEAVSESNQSAKNEILGILRPSGALVHNSTSLTHSYSESPFEEEVYVALLSHLPKERIAQQYWAGGFRIDMVILNVNETKPILAIECDGAKFHTGLASHAWDIYRQQVIEKSLQIKFHRIWSTDWWRDNDGELQKLISRIPI